MTRCSQVASFTVIKHPFKLLIITYRKLDGKSSLYIYIYMCVVTKQHTSDVSVKMKTL